ncbi:MAG TPA: hypothetical protein VF149_05015 [Bacillales bacterium]
MTLPKQFDINEWFLIGTSLLMIVIFFSLQRRFAYVQVVVILVINFFLAAVLDNILAGPPLDLYDVMDRPEFGYMDFFTYIFVYPLTAYVVVYYYDKWQVNKQWLFWYVIGCAGVALGLERLSSLFHVFSYNHWPIYGSLIVYFLSYFLNIMIFHFTKKYI